VNRVAIKLINGSALFTKDMRIDSMAPILSDKVSQKHTFPDHLLFSISFLVNSTHHGSFPTEILHYSNTVEQLPYDTNPFVSALHDALLEFGISHVKECRNRKCKCHASKSHQRRPSKEGTEIRQRNNNAQRYRNEEEKDIPVSCDSVTMG